MSISKNNYTLELKKTIKDLRYARNEEDIQYYKGKRIGLMFVLLNAGIVTKEELEHIAGTDDMPSVIDTKEMNAFDALVELANAENWCCESPCGTCGNEDFGYGFLQLAEGKNPNSSDWLSSWYINKHKIYMFPCKYTLSHEVKQAVLKIILESNLKNISKYFSLLQYHLRPERNEDKELFSQFEICMFQYWEDKRKEIDKNTYVSEINVAEPVKTGERKEEPNVAYEIMLDIINNKPNTDNVRIDVYGTQYDVDLLDDKQYKILCEKLEKYDKDTPLGKFKEKFLNGRL